MFKSPYVYNSVFIPLNAPAYFTLDKEPEDFRYSGKIEITYQTITDLHIGSGFFNIDAKKVNYAQTLKENGCAVIPGSSLKGAVRNIAAIVSDSCHPPMKNNDFPKINYGFENIKCSAEKRCITCDMFGTMSFKSKVIFSDFVSKDARYELKEENRRFSPKIDKNSKKIYLNNNSTVKGYKIYKTQCVKYKLPDLNETVEVVKPGSSFFGTVYFDSLTTNEVRLLCFSLGLGGNINLKIGAWKNDGMGQIAASGTLYSKSIKSTAEALGADYPKKYGRKCFKSINELCMALKPTGGARR